ncbi:DNA-3-methyladenine glycosylase I [Cellulomonas endophytica]|uniref:DNA-3-methyladenine glycosylase I n=1 Tax=Cellulomonas endophytica TaxID=2494735 RepID=UPI00101388BE|nr:DNA-3-methyladenine glycosylase I [Cellulomonas endophytica]
MTTTPTAAAPSDPGLTAAAAPAPTTGPAGDADPGRPAAGRRCFGDGDPLYERYHDEEWGVPVHDDTALLERLALEGFQSGLAWITVLRKRPAFREAFAGFDPVTVAGYDEHDVERLMADAGIVRNRAKISATIANARALVELHAAGRTLDEVLWSHAPAGPRPRAATFAEVPGSTPESVALAKALKRLGFRFVGPTTAYAAMQACGVVDDHLAGCPVVLAGRG